MSAAIGVREDFEADELRCMARTVKDANQARRLLALAAVFDGMDREEAARIGGMDRQTLRDWVHRFNRQGPEGLINAKPPGRAGGRIISTVAVLNFFTVAHDLFMIADNAKPRERLLKSLRVADQFHGARYELMIASCLVRAGFTIEFADEADSTRRHGDATAQHRRTGRSYFVEMKAKGRPGILGKPGP